MSLLEVLAAKKGQKFIASGAPVTGKFHSLVFNEDSEVTEILDQNEEAIMTDFNTQTIKAGIFLGSGVEYISSIHLASGSAIAYKKLDD